MSVAQEQRRACEHLEESKAAIARRIRSIRQPDLDWTMRTSELLSTTVYRVLTATDRGERSMPVRQFGQLLADVIRSTIIDAIRRKTARRRAHKCMQERAKNMAWFTGSEMIHDQHDRSRTENCRESAQQILDRLNTDDRELLHLWMTCGDWGKVASALGISRSAAHKRWSVLRSQVRERGS